MNFPSPPPFFIKTQFIVGSPEGKKISRMFRIYHIPLLKLLMRYNSEKDRNKSALYKVRSRHNEWLLVLLITENLPKKSYQFLKYARACVFA